jgi:hypothetical protein
MCVLSQFANGPRTRPRSLARRQHGSHAERLQGARLRTASERTAFAVESSDLELAYENKLVVRGFSDMVDGGDLSQLEVLCAPDIVNHAVAPGRPNGIAGRVSSCRHVAGWRMLAAGSSVSWWQKGDYMVECGVRAGNWPWGSLRGFEVPGGPDRLDIAFMYRLEDGRIAERWAVRDGPPSCFSSARLFLPRRPTNECSTRSRASVDLAPPLVRSRGADSGRSWRPSLWTFGASLGAADRNVPVVGVLTSWVGAPRLWER